MIFSSNSDLSGHEVYYTACSLPATSKILCGKPHRQKGFDLILFSHKGSHLASAREVVDTTDVSTGVPRT